MFSNKFEHLTHKHPQNAEELHRVFSYLNDWETKGKDAASIRLTPERLKTIANVRNNTLLASLIHVLLSEKIFDRYLIVNSPAGGAVAEFTSIADVPEHIHDTIRDVEMDVTPEFLKTQYKVHIGS